MGQTKDRRRRTGLTEGGHRTTTTTTTDGRTDGRRRWTEDALTTTTTGRTTDGRTIGWTDGGGRPRRKRGRRRDWTATGQQCWARCWSILRHWQLQKLSQGASRSSSQSSRRSKSRICGPGPKLAAAGSVTSNRAAATFTKTGGAGALTCYVGICLCCSTLCAGTIC